MQLTCTKKINNNINKISILGFLVSIQYRYAKYRDTILYQYFSPPLVFKYLGTEMDTSLSSQHTDTTYKKTQQCLHLLRKLRSFQVSKDFLTLVYRSLIESVLTFNISSWYNQRTIKHKTKLTRIVNQAGKITVSPQPPVSELYNRAVIRKANLITGDPLTLSITPSSCYHQAGISMYLWPVKTPARNPSSSLQ